MSDTKLIYYKLHNETMKSFRISDRICVQREVELFRIMESVGEHLEQKDKSFPLHVEMYDENKMFVGLFYIETELETCFYPSRVRVRDQ